MPAIHADIRGDQADPQHAWAHRQSGGAANGRREADEGRADQHHCGFVAKPGRRNPDTLHRDRRRRLALVHGWTRRRGKRRGPQYNQQNKTGEHQINVLPTHDPNLIPPFAAG